MRRLLALLPAALLLAGCGLLYAEVEIQRLEATLVEEPVIATPIGGTLTKSFEYDLGKDVGLLNEKHVTYELRLDAFAVAVSANQPAGTPAIDLSSIDTLTLQVMPPAGSTLPAETVVSYTKPAGATALTRIEASGNGNVDLGPYLQSGKLSLTITATGSLPNFPWNADITADLYAKLKVNYGNYL